MKLEVVQNTAVRQPPVTALNDEILPDLHLLSWLPNQLITSYSGSD